MGTSFYIYNTQLQKLTKSEKLICGIADLIDLLESLYFIKDAFRVHFPQEVNTSAISSGYTTLWQSNPDGRF